MKNRLLRNWNLMRISRLLIGVGFIIAGLTGNGHFLTLAGLFLTYMAIANQGCCEVNACSVTHRTIQKTEKEKLHEEMAD